MEKIKEQLLSKKQPVASVARLHSVEQSSPTISSQPDKKVLQRALANPRTASPEAILQLQQTVGNKAVQRLLADKGKSSLNGGIINRKGKDNIFTNIPTHDAALEAGGGYSKNDRIWNKIVDLLEEYARTSDYQQRLDLCDGLEKGIEVWREDYKGNIATVFGFGNVANRKSFLAELEKSIKLERKTLRKEVYTTGLR